MGADIAPTGINAFDPRPREVKGDIYNRVIISADPEFAGFLRVELLQDAKRVNVLSMRLKLALEFLEKTFGSVSVREILEAKAETFASYKNLDFESVATPDGEGTEGWVYFGDEKEACDFAVFAKTLEDGFGLSVNAPMQMEEAPHDWAVLIEYITN
jgi:hypothetical protein